MMILKDLLYVWLECRPKVVKDDQRDE